jgi:hypothetical protein
MTNLIVECHSGHTYAQEPRAFTWHGHRFEVTKIDERWRTPHGPAFAVQTMTKDRFELHYDEQGDRWTVRTFPASDDTSAKRAKVLAFPSCRDRQGPAD